MIIDTINKGSWRATSYDGKSFSLLDTKTGYSIFVHKGVFDFFKKDVKEVYRDESGQLKMTL